jgi:hypothetical protein
MKRKNRKEMSKRRVPIEIIESPNYRPVYASGVFGGLDPHDGRIVFFLDRIRPKMKSDPKGAMELDKVNRELQVEIHMSPSQFASVAKWMIEHVQQFEKRVKTGDKKEERTETSGTSYIG